MVDKQFVSVNNVPPEPWTEQGTRDRGMRCLIAPHFLALSEGWFRRFRAKPVGHVPRIQGRLAVKWNASPEIKNAAQMPRQPCRSSRAGLQVMIYAAIRSTGDNADR